jgi:hypothetical protein
MELQVSQEVSNQWYTNLMYIINFDNDWFSLLLDQHFEIYSLVSSILFVTKKKTWILHSQENMTTSFTPNTPTSTLEGFGFSPLGLEKTTPTFDSILDFGTTFSPELDTKFSHLLSSEDSVFSSLGIPSPISLNQSISSSNVVIPKTKAPILKLPPKKIRKKEDNTGSLDKPPLSTIPTSSTIPSTTMIPATTIHPFQQFINQQTTNLTLQGERCWKMIYKQQNLLQQFNIRIFTKTRCDTPCEHVTEKMYSSLKYEIRQQITGPICAQQPFLLGRIQVVDSSTGQAIQKSDKKTVLKGVVECALTKPPGAKDQFEIQGVMKVQFTDVSYHHKKRDFCWELRYYVPNDLDNAILVMRSAPFKVFARKPNQNKKRKRTSTSYEDFCNRLEDLIRVSKKLKADERKTALQLVSSKLLQSDPEYMKEIQQQGGNGF